MSYKNTNERDWGDGDIYYAERKQMLTMSSAISHNTDQMPTHPLALVEENGKQ